MSRWLSALMIGLLFIASACTTTDDRVPQPPSTPPPLVSSEVTPQAVKNRLKIDRSVSDIGFKEVKFNRCDLGLSQMNCRNEYLVMIYFRMQCRQSEGTVDTVSHDELFPIVSNKLWWKLGSSTGLTQTNDQGYGRVEVIRATSAQNERLRLTIDSRFVATPASEAGRLVVPGNWCQ